MATIYRVSMTQAEYDSYKSNPANTVPNNYQILITDAPVGTPNLYTGTGTNTPTSSGGVEWEKIQITTANYVLTPSAIGASRDFHIEVGGSLALLTSAQYPVPASGVDQLRIRNFSGSAKTLTAGTGWTIVTADGNPVTGGSYSIPDDRAIEVTLDPDGFAQVVPWGGEVSEATFNTGMAGKSDTTHAHTGTYEPLNANIQSHVTSAHAPANAEMNIPPDWNAVSGDGQILNKPTIPTVNNTLTSTSTSEALSAAQGKALQDGKRELYSLGHPYHTAATEAGHIVTGTSQFNADYAPWKALQASPVGLSEWATAGATAASLTYQLPQATVFNRVVLMGRLSGIEYPTIWSIEGSNDGTTYTTLVASHTESLQAEVTKDFTNTTAYKYYRFSYTAVVGTNSGLNHIRYYHTGINYLPILPNSISVKVTRSTAQSLSSAGTIVSWDTVDHEVGATTLWDVANPTRLTAPIAGTYMIVADIAAESDSIGQITILRNGTAVHNGTAPRFWTGSGSTSALVRLAAGDYIECRVTPATTVNSIVAAERHYLAMVFVSL